MRKKIKVEVIMFMAPVTCVTLRQMIRKLYGQFDRDAVSKYEPLYVLHTPNSNSEIEYFIN